MIKIKSCIQKHEFQSKIATQHLHIIVHKYVKVYFVTRLLVSSVFNLGAKLS